MRGRARNACSRLKTIERIVEQMRQDELRAATRDEAKLSRMKGTL